PRSLVRVPRPLLGNGAGRSGSARVRSGRHASTLDAQRGAVSFAQLAWKRNELRAVSELHEPLHHLRREAVLDLDRRSRPCCRGPPPPRRSSRGPSAAPSAAPPPTPPATTHEEARQLER